MKKWKIWLIIAIVFISGLIVGSAGTGFYMRQRVGGILHRGPGAVKEMVMKKLTAELGLTTDQQADVEQIVEGTQYKLMQLRAQYRPQLEAIVSAGITDMKAKLSPEQQKKLDALYEKAKLRWSMRKRLRQETR